MTVVIGASVGAKLVMVWGTPSTAMVTPACGGGVAAVGGFSEAGFCCCCGGGGAPPCGPLGAWANAEFSASGKTRQVASAASKTTGKMAFMVHLLVAIDKY